MTAGAPGRRPPRPRAPGPGGVHVAPRRLVTDADRTALRTNKPAVLAFLADLEQLERAGTVAQLRAIASTLTAEEHHRLAAEAATGDRLAELVVAVLAAIPRTEAL